MSVFFIIYLVLNVTNSSILLTINSELGVNLCRSFWISIKVCMWTFVDPFDYQFSSECERPFDYQFSFVFEHLSIFSVIDSGLKVNICRSFDYQFRFVYEHLSIFLVINSGLCVNICRSFSDRFWFGCNSLSILIINNLVLNVNICRSFQLSIQIFKWTFVDLFSYRFGFGGKYERSEGEPEKDKVVNGAKLRTVRTPHLEHSKMGKGLWRKMETIKRNRKREVRR